MRKEYQHPEYNLTIVERCAYGPRGVEEFVEIPYTHTGYGATSVELSNDRAIGEDSNLIGRLNLDNHDTLFWYAIIRDYTTEQWEELEELVAQLQDYPLLDESLYSEVDNELREQYIQDCLPYDTDVDVCDWMIAASELGIWIEPDGDTYFITDDDFKTVLEYAEGLKSGQLANA